MNESFIGAPPMNEKIEFFGHSVLEITDFNLLILMQIDNAPEEWMQAQFKPK